MKLIKTIFIFFLLFNYYYSISENIIPNKEKKIIYFDLDTKQDIIIKDVYLKKYNSYSNIAIDTLGFISGLFISKDLRYDFILGDTFSPMNSYRIFEGNSANINIYENKNNSDFNIVIFKSYKNYKFFYKNKTYDGILGLALNYTSDIVIDESYFFGEDKKYSIMNYLIYELHLIEQNIFSIYKNKFILGGINEEINNKIKYCKTRDKIEESFIYFFWNCDIESIYIGNIYNKSNNIKISLLIDSLLKDYIISTSIKVANYIVDQINSELKYKNRCNINQNRIYCLMEIYDIMINENLKLYLNNETIIEIPFEILIINKTNNYFNLNIEIYEFNIDKHQNILKIGKVLFNLYNMIFDADNKRIGFQSLKDNDNLILDKKYYYKNVFPYKDKNNLNANKILIINLLFFIVILICFIGIIFLLYGKNNYYY